MRFVAAEPVPTLMSAMTVSGDTMPAYTAVLQSDIDALSMSMSPFQIAVPLIVHNPRHSGMELRKKDFIGRIP